MDSLSQKSLQKILNGLISSEYFWKEFNPLNAKLNPICHLLSLLGTHHFYHVSGVMVKIPSSPDKEWPKNGEFPKLGTTYPKMLQSKLLKHTVCSQVTKQHISLISQKFSNPTSLSLSDMHTYVLTSLRNLRHLRGFSLIDSTCHLVVGLLEASGSQPTSQKFVDVNGKDFSFIGDKCPSLLYLLLCFDSDQSIQPHRTYKEAKPDNMHVPNVESVRFLQLFLTKFIRSLVFSL